MKNYIDSDYTKYKEIQVHRSKKKWSSLTFKENIEIFEKMLDMGKEYINPKAITCCMGIRGGNEYTEFKERYPEMSVYGVDIVPDVVNVGKNCFAFDFAELPPEWSDRFDIVYSNSIDHSFDIQKTIKEWYRVTKNGGYILLTMSKLDKIDASDRYGFDTDDIKELFDTERFEILSTHEFSNHPVFNVILRVKK